MTQNIICNTFHNKQKSFKNLKMDFWGFLGFKNRKNPGFFRTNLSSHGYNVTWQTALPPCWVMTSTGGHDIGPSPSAV